MIEWRHTLERIEIVETREMQTPARETQKPRSPSKKQFCACQQQLTNVGKGFGSELQVLLLWTEEFDRSNPLFSPLFARNSDPHGVLRP